VNRRFVPAKPRSNKDLESLSLNLVKHYQPGVINQKQRFDTEEFFDVDLEKLTGVATDYQHLESGIYGYTDTDEMVCAISKELADDPSSEYFFRSTTAHEIAHAVLHVSDYRLRRAILRSVNKKGHDSLRLFHESEIPLYRNPEWQAWRFAGALLMPAQAFLSAVKSGESLRDLSQHFGVNASFVMTRARSLKINVKN